MERFLVQSILNMYPESGGLCLVSGNMHIEGYVIDGINGKKQNKAKKNNYESLV